MTSSTIASPLKSHAQVSTAPTIVLRSVNTVFAPKHTVVGVKFATGFALTSTARVIVLIQPLSEVTVRVALYCPDAR